LGTGVARYTGCMTELSGRRILAASTLAAVTATGVGVAAPAGAATALHGSKHGYSLTLRGGTAKLVIPRKAARHDKYVPFQVTCAGKNIIAFAALRSGTRRFQGPYTGGVKVGATCVIKKRGHKVAAFRMHH